MILLSDEEWDILDLKNAFGSGTTSRDNVISKVHEIYDQVHFVCVRNASNQFSLGIFAVEMLTLQIAVLTFIKTKCTAQITLIKCSKRNNHTGDLDAQFMKERICNGRSQNYHKVKYY